MMRKIILEAVQIFLELKNMASRCQQQNQIIFQLIHKASVMSPSDREFCNFDWKTYTIYLWIAFSNWLQTNKFNGLLYTISITIDNKWKNIFGNLWSAISATNNGKHMYIPPPDKMKRIFSFPHFQTPWTMNHLPTVPANRRAMYKSTASFPYKTNNQKL